MQYIFTRQKHQKLKVLWDFLIFSNSVINRFLLGRSIAKGTWEGVHFVQDRYFLVEVEKHDSNFCDKVMKCLANITAKGSTIEAF